MPLFVDIQTDDITRLRQRVNGFIEQTPAIQQEFSEEFAEDLVDAVKDSVDKTFSETGSTGNLKGNVKKRRRGKRRYTVSANAYNDGVNYAAWHEYANSGHYAYYEDVTGRNEELIRWARAMGIYDDTWRIKVKPRSFMKPGVQKAISKARKNMRNGRTAVHEGLAKAFRG